MRWTPEKVAELRRLAPEGGAFVAMRLTTAAPTATAEGTASYVIAASVLTRARLQPGQFAQGTFHFDDGRFAITVFVDTSHPSCPFMELIHQTRDEREGDRVASDRIRLLWAVPT
jgi:hypothetical protein